MSNGILGACYHHSGQTKTCARCGTTFRRPANVGTTNWAKRRYCGQSCAATVNLSARHGALVPTAELDQRWRARAACRGRDTDLFVPDHRGPHWTPPAECGWCPVRAECSAYGQATKSIGVWGGRYLRAVQ